MSTRKRTQPDDPRTSDEVVPTDLDWDDLSEGAFDEEVGLFDLEGVDAIDDLDDLDDVMGPELEEIPELEITDENDTTQLINSNVLDKLLFDHDLKEDSELEPESLPLITPPAIPKLPGNTTARGLPGEPKEQPKHSAQPEATAAPAPLPPTTAPALPPTPAPSALNPDLPPLATGKKVLKPRTLPSTRLSRSISSPSSQALRAISRSSEPSGIAPTGIRAAYVREALALAEDRPERAAMMWSHAAIAGEGSDSRPALDDVIEALILQPQSAWLLPLARRLSFQYGDYSQSLALGVRLVGLGGDRNTRAAILVEMASVLWHGDGDRRAALKSIERALELRPGYALGLTMDIALRTELGLHATAAASLERLTDTLSSANERALLLYRAATVYETRLDDLDAAEAAYSRAIEEDPEHLPAVLALCALYQNRRKWLPLCRCLERLASLVPDTADRARILLEAGALHIERTGQFHVAARHLDEASQIRTPNLLALVRLTQAFEANDRPGDLVNTLRRQLVLTVNKEARAELQSRIGFVLESRMEDVNGAIEAYNDALASCEGYLPALESLCNLYRQTGAHDALLDILTREREGSLPAERRAARALEMARLLTSLGRFEEAIAAYSRTLELNADLRVAAWEFIALLREQPDQHHTLAEQLRALILSSSDVKTRTSLCVQLAQLQASALADLDGALQTLERAPRGNQSRDVALELIGLYTRAGQHDKLVALLVEQAEDTKDHDESQGRLLQAAHLLEFDLDELERAMELYERVLEADPRDAIAVDGIRRIAYRLEQWTRLVSLNRHEIKTNPRRSDAFALQNEVGRLLEAQLEQPDLAMDAYTRALEMAPSSTTTFAAIERLARRLGRWQDLIEVLARRSDHIESKEQSTDALCRAAEIADWQLEDLAQAVKLYSRAMEKDASSAAAGYGLLRVRRQQANYAEAGAVLETLITMASAPDEIGRLKLQLARVREFRLNLKQPLDLYLDAAVASFGDRLRAELVRVQRLLKTGDLAQSLFALGEHTEDPALAASTYIQSAWAHQFQSEPEQALAPAELAASHTPDDHVVVWSLERALSSTKDWERLGDLRERAAQVELDPKRRVLRLTEALHAFAMADTWPSIERTARECLNFDAHCLPALYALVDHAKHTEAHRDTAGLLDRLAEANTHPVNRLDSSLEAAVLWAGPLENATRALASLAVPLTDDPCQDKPFALAEQLLRQRSEYSELSRLFIRRIRATPPTESAPLRQRHAVLLREEMQDLPRACAELSAILEHNPDEIEVLTELIALLTEQHRWADAAASLERLIEADTDDSVRHQARLQLVDLRLNRLHEPDKARGVLRSAVEARPDDVGAARAMVALDTASGQWKQANTTLEKLLAREDLNHDDRLWALLSMANVARRGLRNRELERMCEINAIREATSGPGAMALVVADFRKRDALRRFGELGMSLLEDSDESSPALRLAVARAMIFELDDPDSAIKIAQREMTRPDAGHEPRLLIAHALEHQGQYDEALEAFRVVALEHPIDPEAFGGIARVGRRLTLPELVLNAESMRRLLTPDSPKDDAPRHHSKPPKGKVPLSDIVPLPDGVQPLVQVLEYLAPHLTGIYRDGDDADYERVENADALADCQGLADALGLGPVEILLADAGDRADAEIGHPVQISLPEELVDQAGTPAFRFQVGSALALAAGVGSLVKRQSDAELTRIIEALFNRWPKDPEAKVRRKQLQKHVPKSAFKNARSLNEPTPQDVQWIALRQAEQRRADRVGLLLCRDLSAALEVLIRSDANLKEALEDKVTADLLAFGLSDTFLNLSRQVWTRG